ncbi:glutamate racemase [Gynuella sunshinyii]|uniref:Glutamate racemase n=1 Tax=Gynuella sunshinyii YC6258 TaxID=1445510 RepID=A0A0C5W1I5_9GAMM|nr:glutamate racemase [Gynuella sunshinyii]AJQ96539.1 glutamate racemase [Gynuella sunshinyii YC6258]
MSEPVRVLVFDSGVGGLSIVAEIKKLVSGVDIFFAADNAAFPYGIREESFLVSRIQQVMMRLQSYCHADMIVVACNTASTAALGMLRSHFDIPVVGVVPAIKPAAEQSQTGKIGLLATPATIARPYTRKLIHDFASHCELRMIGSSRLVEIAEQKLRAETVNLAEIADILSPFSDFQDMDRMVLACTHFPLLREEIQEVLGAGVVCVDSGGAIARRVLSLIQRQSLSDRKGHDPASLARVIFTREDHMQPYLECCDHWPAKHYVVIDTPLVI